MSIQLREGYDVIVAGGGTAGVIAAVAAARAGARTLLVEQNAFVGGTAATGLPIIAFHDNNDNQIVGGIPWEFACRLIDAGEAAHIITADTEGDWGRGGANYTSRKIAVRPEGYRCTALEMLDEAGVDLLLHTFVTDVVMDGPRLTGLVIAGKAETAIVPAQVVIDCTGDGDVSVRAGASYETGRARDQITQPMSMLFTMTGVDAEAAVRAGAAEGPLNLRIEGPEEWCRRVRRYTIQFHAWREEFRREVPGLTGLRMTISDWGDDTYYCGNGLHIARLDASQIESLTEAQARGVRSIGRLTRFLRKHVPGFEGCHLITTYEVGVRETRRILGDYYLTYEDVLEARRHPDDVLLCGYWVDIHDYEGFGLHTPKQGTQVRDGGAYGIPYGCLLPKGLEGLLVAGRHLSSDHEAQSSARVIATCMGMGQAAGLAAAHAVRQGGTPRGVDVDALRTALVSQGGIL